MGVNQVNQRVVMAEIVATQSSAIHFEEFQDVNYDAGPRVPPARRRIGRILAMIYGGSPYVWRLRCARAWDRPPVLENRLRHAAMAPLSVAEMVERFETHGLVPRGWQSEDSARRFGAVKQTWVKTGKRAAPCEFGDVDLDRPFRSFHAPPTLNVTAVYSRVYIRKDQPIKVQGPVRNRPLARTTLPGTIYENIETCASETCVRNVLPEPKGQLFALLAADWDRAAAAECIARQATQRDVVCWVLGVPTSAERRAHADIASLGYGMDTSDAAGPNAVILVCPGLEILPTARIFV